MEVLNIGCHETDVMELAENLNLTFYDASYIFLDMSKNIPLVTEEKDIKNKIGNYVRVLSVGDF